MISIIICTYNSEKILKRTLTCLNNSMYNLKNLNDIELIIVNNNSDDNTRKIAFETKTLCKKIIVDEPKSGLMHARKAGTLKANFNWIVFLDDDNLVSEDYLFKVREVLLKPDSLKKIYNCKIYPINSDDETWSPNDLIMLKSSYDKLACNVLNLDQNIKISQPLVGAGLIVRTDLLKFFFNSGYKKIGRTANSLSSGEDTEIINFMIGKDCVKFFINSTFIQHVIPKKRLQIDYLEKLFTNIYRDNKSGKLKSYFKYLYYKYFFFKKDLSSIVKRYLMLHAIRLNKD